MKTIKKLFAVVLAIALIVSCFALPASAASTTTYYVAGLAYINVTNDNYDYADSIFVTLEFLKLAGVVERTGNFGGDFSYSHNGTTIYSYEKLNDNGKYYGHPNPNTTDSDDFTYEIKQADKDRNYTGTQLDCNANVQSVRNSLLQADVIIVNVSTNPVIDVSEEYMDAYLKETVITFPGDVSKQLNENSSLSVTEMYDACRLYKVGCALLDTGCLGLEESGQCLLVTTKDGKPLFSSDPYSSSLELTLESGVTYEDNINWTNDKTMDDVKDGTVVGTKKYFKTITFIHGKEYTADDTSWIKGSSDGKSVKSNAAMADFKFVMVDGNVVDSANFDITEGSTIVTFKPAYLATLSLGDHPVIIGSKNGVAESVLTIKEAPTPTPTPEKKTEEKKTEEKTVETEKIADTSDNNMIGAFVALGTMSAVAYVSLKKRED